MKEENKRINCYGNLKGLHFLQLAHMRDFRLRGAAYGMNEAGHLKFQNMKAN